jgi:septin family protein
LRISRECDFSLIVAHQLLFHRLAFKRHTSEKHYEGYRAEAEHVDPDVVVLSCQHLRRDIARTPNEEIFLRNTFESCCEAKVDEVYQPVSSDYYVFYLDIAVRDSLPV